MAKKEKKVKLKENEIVFYDKKIDSLEYWSNNQVSYCAHSINKYLEIYHSNENEEEITGFRINWLSDLFKLAKQSDERPLTQEQEKLLDKTMRAIFGEPIDNPQNSGENNNEKKD